LEPVDGRAAREINLPAQEQCQRQLQRILHSAAFRNASMLQQLLQFLTVRAYDNGGESLKEYTIGVEALNRPQDFDPKTDTIVRVQIHRLRQKLKEYYDTDGNRDPILIEIPKGHYLPSFEILPDSSHGVNQDSAPPLNTNPSVAASSTERNVEETGPRADRQIQHPGRPLFSLALTAGIVVIVAFAAGLWIGRDHLRYGAGKAASLAHMDLNSSNAADPVKAFWATFLGNDLTPVIAYPDAVFLLDDSNDLFRFRRGASDDRGALVDPHLARQFASNPALVARAGQLYYENAYLGSGELKGLAMLSNLFGQMGIRPIIKPSREITPDDLKQHNVIMLGSSFQNFAVAQLSTMGDFSFKNPDTRLEQWRGLIVNSHPRPHEASSYHTERDPITKVLKVDYSLISIQPGVVAGRYIATLGGLDTTGTEGAVMFATSRPGVEELSRGLATSGESSGGDVPPMFQAILAVHLEKGYEVLGASLLTVHMLPTSPSRSAGTTSQAPVH
jgi:hypothetical protein